MKPIWITASALATILALSGCKYRKTEPIPPPRAAVGPSGAAAIHVPAPPVSLVATAKGL